MAIFRRSFDARHAIARSAQPHEAKTIAALGRRAPSCYLTGSIDEVVELVRHEPTAVLEHDTRLVAAVQIGWRLPPNAWLRTVFVDSRVDVGVALRMLLPQAHLLLPASDIDAVYVTLDVWNESWLRTPLEMAGYGYIMQIWSYNKETMDVPSTGNQAVHVRPVRPDDLQAVLHVDAACFPEPWSKGEEIMEPALLSAPYFAVAEWDGEVIGYAHVSLYGSGRHAHLVRIAVAPAFQGSGVGVRLLAEVVRFCRYRQVDVLTLNTQDGNIQAQRLYEWFGFRRAGESQTVLGIKQVSC